MDELGKTESELLIYPVPANESFVIELAESMEPGSYHIRIYNSLGEMVYSGQQQDRQKTIGTNGFAEGVYQVVIAGPNDTVEYRKIIVVH